MKSATLMAVSADSDICDTFAELPDERISQELTEWFQNILSMVIGWLVHDQS